MSQPEPEEYNDETYPKSSVYQRGFEDGYYEHKDRPQPIETAPKDGTDILAWESGWQIVHYDGGWRDNNEGTFWPTYWLPLPPPARREEDPA